MSQAVIISILIFFAIIILAASWKFIIFLFLFFGAIFIYLYEIVIWRFSKPKYLGRMCLYKGQRRKIITETFDCVQLKGINGREQGKKIGFSKVKKSDILLLEEVFPEPKYKRSFIDAWNLFGREKKHAE